MSTEILTPTLRQSQASDYGVIADIYNESIQQGGITFDEDEFTADHIHKWVKTMTPREGLWVIAQAQSIMGWGILKRYSDRPAYRLTVESSIYLSQAYRGQGYGSQLQDKLLTLAKGFGYHHIVAKIVASNQSSIQFHQRFGYELVGIQTEVGYSQGQWHDIAILQCILSSPLSSII